MQSKNERVQKIVGQFKRNVVGGGLTGLIMLAANAQAAAQENDSAIALSNMTVTAERFPAVEKASSRFITVLQAAELKKTGANSVDDALQRSGGFVSKAFGPLGISNGGMNSQLRIRGIEGGELILINGVPIQAAASHAYDLHSIPIEQIERIEILKGAASTLYGADAMTGVVNIITKAPGTEQKTSVSAEFGNHGWQHHAVAANFSGVNLGFNYEHLDSIDKVSRNFSRNYDYDLDATDKYSFNLNARLFDNLHLDYLGSYYKTGFQRHYDGNARPSEKTDQKHYKNFLDLRYENENFRGKVFGMFEQMKLDEYTSNDPEDRNKNYNYGVSGDYKWLIADVEAVVGAEWIYRGADYNTQYGRHYRIDRAVFAQLKKEFFRRLIVTLGAREQFVDGKSDAADYNRFLPSFGATFKATENLNVFANAGKAFKAPTFNQLYYDSPMLLGNPDLAPEEGWTFETGFKYDSAMTSLRLALFHMTYDDKIEYQFPSYINAKGYESTGVEWDFSFFPFIERTDFLQHVSVSTAGYWAEPEAEDKDGESYRAGAKFQNSVALAYDTQQLSLNLNCSIIAGRENALESNAPVNFAGKYRIGAGHLTFAVDNILNEEVQRHGVLEPDARTRYVYYEPSRMVKLGYTMDF